jgi:alginate O-acetyltransferase complex protein AlgJ
MLVFAGLSCADRDTDELKAQFRVASRALVDQLVPGSKKVVKAHDGWLFTVGEVRYLNAGSFVGENAPLANPKAPPGRADPVPVIVDFHRQLEKRGIEMYIMPVPARATIYPESVLGSEPFARHRAIPDLDPRPQELFSVLREHGVQVIDLTPTFLDQREHSEHGSVFCPSDTHWTPYGITLAAKMVAAEIKEKPWFEAVPKQKYRQRWTTSKINGLLYRNYENASGMALEPDSVRMRRILLETQEGLEKFGRSHPQSPVVVIGDSNTVRWTQYRSALYHSLAFELGFPVDVLSSSGGGANESRLNLIRKFRAEPEYLEGKRVVIWCFSMRSFTNTPKGWIPIPF